MTWIARVGDGLPLAASIPEDEEVKIFTLFTYNTCSNIASPL